MIIDRCKAQALIDSGQATLQGTTTDDLGQRWFILIDHYRCCTLHVLQTDDEPDLQERTACN